MNSPEYQSNLGSPAPSMSADEGSNSGGGEEEGEEIGEDQRVLSREDVKGMCARDIRLREREQQVCVPSPPPTHTYFFLLISASLSSHSRLCRTRSGSSHIQR